MNSIRSAGIVGFGRFGALFCELLSNLGVQTRFYDRNIDSSSTLHEVYESDLVILCVPISKFESTVNEGKQYIRSGTIVMDVCSVKVHPRNIMLENLPKDCEIVCSHPMFGPATVRQRKGDTKDLRIILDKSRCGNEAFKELKNLFSKLELEIIELSADEHDRLTARFQFITLAAGLLLKDIELSRSKLDTKSASVMMDFLDLISIDKSLLVDMYKYNPYCKAKWSELERSFKNLSQLLLGNE